MNSQRNSRKEIKSSFISFKLFFLFLNYMSLWICGHMRLLQLSNFDFQDVLQHSLKSTMDFWYKFIQPQTFSFPAFFHFLLSFSIYSKLNRGISGTFHSVKSRKCWSLTLEQAKYACAFLIASCGNAIFSLNQANLFNFPLWWFSKNIMRNDEFD